MWRGGTNWNDANCDGTKPYVCGFTDGVCGGDANVCTFEFNDGPATVNGAEDACLTNGGFLAWFSRACEPLLPAQCVCLYATAYRPTTAMPTVSAGPARWLAMQFWPRRWLV